MNLITMAMAVWLSVTSPSVVTYQKPPEPVRIYYQPTHQQKVWLGALEWCESAGIKTAINPKDKDGTPSYYSFQFKPETFKLFLKKYEIPETDISDYKTQYLIVSQMLNDKSVKWNKQFPSCVKKLGWPPKPPSETTL